MRLFDSDYYKTFLEPEMDADEFKKRLIIALEAEYRIDPEHFQAICDGEDLDFIQLVKEEYKQSLAYNETSDEKELIVNEAEEALGERQLESFEIEEESVYEEDSLKEEFEAASVEALSKELSDKEKAAAKKERAEASRNKQERYRIEAEQRERQYQAYLNSLQKDEVPPEPKTYEQAPYQTYSYDAKAYGDESYEEQARNAPYVKETPSDKPYSEQPVTYDRPTYEKEPSTYNQTQEYHVHKEALYHKEKLDDYIYEEQKAAHRQQINDEMEAMRARYYERQRAWENYESVNTDGHFTFDGQSRTEESHRYAFIQPDYEHVPYNVFSNPYVSYEPHQHVPYQPEAVHIPHNIYERSQSSYESPTYQTPDASIYSKEPTYRHLYEQNKRELYEKRQDEIREATKERMADTMQSHFEKQTKDISAQSNASNIPYNVFAKPHISYESTSYESQSSMPQSYMPQSYYSFGNLHDPIIHSTNKQYKPYPYTIRQSDGHTSYEDHAGEVRNKHVKTANSDILPQTRTKDIPYNVYAKPHIQYKALPYQAYQTSVYQNLPLYHNRYASHKGSLYTPSQIHFKNNTNHTTNSTTNPTPVIPYKVLSSQHIKNTFFPKTQSAYSYHPYHSSPSKSPSNFHYRLNTGNHVPPPINVSGHGKVPNAYTPRTSPGQNQSNLSRKASRLEERYHALYSSKSGLHQKIAALTHVTGYARLSNRAQMEFARYMRSSMSSGDETGDALRVKYMYGDKVRLGVATGSMIAAYSFMAGAKGHIYDVAITNKLKKDLKALNRSFKGQGAGIGLRSKVFNAEATMHRLNKRIDKLSAMDTLSKKDATRLTKLKQSRDAKETLIQDLKSGLKTKQDIKSQYWKDRDALSSLLKKNKRNLLAAEKQLGISGISTRMLKKEIKILSKKEKLGLLTAKEAKRLKDLKVGLSIRQYRMAKNDRTNSRKNALSYVYYAFRGNSSFDDASGLHGAVTLADFSNNYYVKKTVASFYKATKRIGVYVKRVGKATSKYVWSKAIQTPLGASVDGSIIVMKAKMNLLKNATTQFAKRQIMTAANTKIGIGLKMKAMSISKKYTQSVRFVKRIADRGGKVLKVVQAPFKYLMKAFRFVKNLFMKAIAILAGVLLFILLMAVIVELFGSSISVIFAPNVNENGLVDLTEYVEHLENVQKDYVKDIEDILDGDYTRIIRNYSYEDNTKEILCMMAVRMDQNLGTVYHNSTEKDECDELFRGQCRGHRDDLDYIELLYDLSHVAYIEESAPYYCESLDCSERMVTIPVDEEMGRGPTTRMEKYCPGDHVDVTITTQVLRFDEIFSVDTVDANGEITAKKGESLGTFTVTAYCACKKCCGENAQGITATGVKPKENHTIAVDPSVIPLGTVVIINGQTYVAEDTGGAIKGNRIDIYFKSHDDALAWGKKECKVYLGTDVGVKDNDTTGESSWAGWTQDNREWAKSLYEADWADLYEGYKALKLDYSGLGIEIESEDFQKIKEILDAKIGCPYVWGAIGPDTFDCSGLVMYVYEQAGLYDWGGARPTTKTLYQQCVPITKAEAKQGDLVLWDIPGNIHHVGIYCGNGIVCHAPHEGDVVKYSKLWGNYGFFRLPED